MKPKPPSVLTVNGGSSSIKFALFEADGALQRILEGRIEGIGLGQGSFKAKGLQASDNFSQPVVAPDHTVAVNVLMDWVKARIESGTLAAVGHRVVHGEPKYWEPQRITVRVIPTDEEWMIATTVCRVLGYTVEKEGNYEKAKH